MHAPAADRDEEKGTPDRAEANVVYSHSNSNHVPAPTYEKSSPDDVHEAPAAHGPPLVVKALGASVGICIIFYLSLFCYLGVSSSSNGYTQNLVVAYADLDQGMVGQAVSKFLSVIPAGNGLPTFELIQAANAEEVTKRVANYDYWGAVIINAGTTAGLTGAIAQGLPYRPASAITIVYDEGRFPTVIAPRIVGPLRGLLPAFLQNFSATFVQRLAAQGGPALVGAVALNSPQLLSTPVYYTEVNLHPATIQVATFGLTVGEILLVVFTWLSWVAAVGLCGGDAPTATHGAAVRRFAQRSAVCLWLTFAISLSFTLIWHALGAAFPSGGAWVGFWLIHWLQMGGYVFVYAAATHVLGLEKAPSFILFTIVFNATAAFNELSLATPFYQWGHALPMRHCVLAARTLLYETRDTLGVDVGALAIWFVAGLVVAAATVPRPRPATAADADAAPRPGPP